MIIFVNIFEINLKSKIYKIIITNYLKNMLNTCLEIN